MMVRSNEIDEPDSLEGSRLNLLLSCEAEQAASAVEQLPRLLEPMGIRTIRATSGQGAATVICKYPIHIAVVDFSIPLTAAGNPRAGGTRILELLRRLEEPPPTVVIRPRQAVARESARGLSEALREGAFAVMDRPIHLESMLEVMRRILKRHYSDVWPA